MDISRIITTTIFLGVMLLLHKALKRYINKSFFLFVWTFVFLYLLLPVQVPSPTSIYNVGTVGGIAGFVQLNYQEPFPTATYEFIPPGNEKAQPQEAQRKSLFNIQGFLKDLPFALWLGGSMAAALFFLQAYRREIGRINASLVPIPDGNLHKVISGFNLKRTPELYLSHQVNSPVTYGILWPKIVLPVNIDEKAMDSIVYILVHEMTHIRRFDLVLKYIGLCALCVHWFNPLVWLAYRQMCIDIEISCDEQVLEWLEEGDKSQYAMTLIALAEQQRSLRMSVINTFGEQPIKERVLHIMTYKKTKFATSLLCAMVMVGTVSVFATTATKGVLENYQEKMAIESETITKKGISITPLQAVSDGEQIYILLDVEHSVFGKNEEGRHLRFTDTDFWVDGKKLEFDDSINKSTDYENDSRLTSRSHYRLQNPYDPLFKENSASDNTLALNEDGTVSSRYHSDSNTDNKTRFIIENREVDPRGKTLKVKINSADYNESLGNRQYKKVAIEGPWEFEIQVHSVNGPLKYNVSAQRDYRGDMFYINEVTISHYYVHLDGEATLYDAFEDRESRLSRRFDDDGEYYTIPVTLLDKDKNVILAMEGNDHFSKVYRHEKNAYDGWVEYDFGYLIDPEDVYYLQLDDILIPLK